MKNFFFKYLIVALFCNATILFSQTTNKTDSLFQVINKKINSKEFESAKALISDLKKTANYKSDSIKLPTDLFLAQLYLAQNKDSLAIEILLKGLSYNKKKKSSKHTSDYAFEIAKNFTKNKNYYKAFEYYRIVLNASKSTNDSLRVSKGFWGLGSVHFYLYRIAKDENMSEMYKDSALYYHQEAISYFPKISNNRRILATIYSNLVGFYFYQKEYKIAEKYGDKSLEIYRELGDSIQMTGILQNLGAVSTLIGDFEKANSYYIKGLNLVDNKSDYDSKKSTQKFYNNLADLNKRRGNYKEAYEFSEGSTYLKDSLRDVDDIEKYAEIEAKYNVAEEEKLTEIEKSKRKTVLYWVYALGLTITLLIVYIVLIDRNQKIKRVNLALEFEQEKLLQDRKIKQIQNEAQIKILNATIDGKETERRQIAEILHNSVSALLSSAGLHLQAVKISLKEKSPKEISKSQEIVKEAGEKIRNLSHALISSVLLKFGLNYALADLCEKYSNSKLKFGSDTLKIKRYDSSFEIKIHSIIEELMNNIIKHSNATKADIVLKEENGILRVRIFDNGDGFDVEKLRSQGDTGLGLPQIDARVQMMEGEFYIQSSSKAGTRIYINVPIPESTSLS